MHDDTIEKDTGIERLIDELLAENERRKSVYAAAYDPLTGGGLEKYLPELEWGRLEIPDYAIPVQYVPKAVLQDEVIKQILKAGSIKKYIETHKWRYSVPDTVDIERSIRSIRHKHDFCYWAYSLVKIESKFGGMIRFKLNYPQLLALRKLEQMRIEGVPIDLIILKARQWGGSTLCIFYQMWLLFKWDSYHSFIVAAHVQSAAETILDMLTTAVTDYPAWDVGLPDTAKLHLAKRGKTGNAYVIKDANGKRVFKGVIYIGSAEKPESLRSSNLHGAHYSEVGVWPDTPKKRPEALIATISGSVSKRKLDMQVMESTAKNSDDFFHEAWSNAKHGVSSYRPIFIPWYYNPFDTLGVRNPRELARWLILNRESEAIEGKWLDSGKHYWWLWELGATLEGINWYRYKRLDFTSYTQMANEAPSDDVEAFASAGLKVFDFYMVENKKKRCREPLFRGDLYSDAKEGEEVLHNIHFDTRRDGLLKVWEMPDDSPISDRYVVAVDIGGPYPTSDYSSIRVMDRLMLMPDFGLGGKPNIVAEMHYHTDHDTLAYDAMRIAAWYNNALLVIESNTVETENKERETGGDGSEYILDIVGSIYPNLYMRKNRSEDVADKVVMKYGFHTNKFTKPKIISFMKTCLREDMWEEPSVTCLDEMGLYVEVDNKFTAPPKKHDDVLMATAILLWISFREMDEPKWITPRKEQTYRRKSQNNVESL